MTDSGSSTSFRFLAAILVGTVAAAAAPGQGLGLRLVSGGCAVSLSTGHNNSIAPNTDVTAGYQIEAANGRGSFARSQLAVSRTADVSTIRLIEATGFYAASSGLPTLLNNLDLTLESTAPGRVRLEIACTWVYQNAPFVNGSASFVGGGIDISAGVFSGELRETRDVDLAATTPVTFRFNDMLWWQSWPASIDWTVRVLAAPDQPCRPTTYGNGCGLDLVLGADLTHFGSGFAELRLRGVSVPGLLIVGVQRTAIPIGPCVLYNNALVVLPVAAGRLYFEVPPFSGFTFLLQGAALDGAGIAASAGTQLTCR